MAKTDGCNGDTDGYKDSASSRPRQVTTASSTSKPQETQVIVILRGSSPAKRRAYCSRIRLSRPYAVEWPSDTLMQTAQLPVHAVAVFEPFIELLRARLSTAPVHHMNQRIALSTLQILTPPQLL